MVIKNFDCIINFFLFRALNSETAASSSLDCQLIKKNMDRVLNSCIERGKASTDSRSECALEIMEKLCLHPFYSHNYSQLIDSILPHLTEVCIQLIHFSNYVYFVDYFNQFKKYKNYFQDYFDNLLNVFQKTNPKHALRIVNAIIGLSKNVIILFYIVVYYFCCRYF